MNLSELLTRNRVVCDGPVTSKKRALELAGELIASADGQINTREIFEILIGRERLGSTGLGHGVALPHGRHHSSTRAVGAFLKIKDGVDFDAGDGQPVDLVFALVVPEHFTDEHLKILAHLAEMFSDQAFCRRLREAESDETLFEHLMSWKPVGPGP